MGSFTLVHSRSDLLDNFILTAPCHIAVTYMQVSLDLALYEDKI
jgi:hypothetical protein